MGHRQRGRKRGTGTDLPDRSETMTHPKSASAHLKRRGRRAAIVGVTFAFAATGAAATSATAATRTADSGPTLTHLARFGSGLGSGSTVGPDGAVYVTDGVSGSVDRVDPRTGAVTVFATGLPPKVLGIGGAMDVAFLDQRMYVMVTMVGGDVVGGPHIGDATVGIYRLGDDGRFVVVADIGSWSVAHPPKPGYFITTGVQYAMISDHGGFLVTDGHHNRVLRVTLDGQISEVVAFDDLVPTGLESQGGTTWITQAGPVPHLPNAGRVLALRTTNPAGRPTSVTEVGRGASLLVDVEMGPRHQLYALSQGQWDGVMEGSPARPNTGRLVRVTRDGALDPVIDVNGSPLVLDRPTSMEFTGGLAVIVSLSGDVYTVHGL
jgi:sugar lactone lactonase YvrE